MADVFTPELTFGPVQLGIMTPTAPGAPYRTIQQSALGPELNGDPGFDDPAYWTADPTVVITGGQAVATNATGFRLLRTPAAQIVAGHTYQVTFTISGFSAGTMKTYLGTGITFGSDRSANGTYTENILAGTGGEFGFNFTTFTGNIDNYSIKEVL